MRILSGGQVPSDIQISLLRQQLAQQQAHLKRVSAVDKKTPERVSLTMLGTEIKNSLPEEGNDSEIKSQQYRALDD